MFSLDFRWIESGKILREGLPVNLRTTRNEAISEISLRVENIYMILVTHKPMAVVLQQLLKRGVGVA